MISDRKYHDKNVEKYLIYFSLNLFWLVYLDFVCYITKFLNHLIHPHVYMPSLDFWRLLTGNRKKSYFFSGPATKALTPPPLELSGHRNFF